MIVNHAPPNAHQPTPFSFRAAALALPLAVEHPHFDTPSFRVEGKIFAQLSADERTGLVKLATARQQFILACHPTQTRPAEHWGRYGWTWLDWPDLPIDLVQTLLQDSWQTVAPRKLHALLVR